MTGIDGIIISKARLAVEASGLTAALTYMACGRHDLAIKLIEEARDMILTDMGEKAKAEAA